MTRSNRCTSRTETGHVPESKRVVQAWEVLSEERCVELLASRDLGRVGLVVGDHPEVFPVTYATDGKVVIFRTARGTVLQRATQGRVAFEVDEWNSQVGLGWSVMLKGVAAELPEGADPFASALREHSVNPLAPGEREVWIAIYPSEITGRRFRRP
jgi:nitroimidazol reductase NimA-like FMN-containing flavoprotein (pyridoxamine 5'-phosphate oxidase superfamily)